MKDLLKNTFPLDGKSLWFLLAGKSVCTTQNEAFIEKYVSTIQKNCFFWKNIEIWFPLARKYFSAKIDSS